MKINQLKIGDKARVISLVGLEKTYRKRLISIGLIPGTEFILSRIAPLGDPIQILVRDFLLSLRKEEAHMLLIEEIA